MARQRISSRATRRACWLAWVASAAVAIAILAVRNLYDDEILSLPIIASSPAAIIRFASTSDVHPPGMYLLAHFALRLVPSFRWMNLIATAVLYVGLAAFVSRFGPLFRRPWPLILFLMLATLHPQLLVWGTSYRWYSWWTGIALVTLVLALRPGRLGSRPIARAVGIGLLLGVLMYISYVTLLFAPALAVAIAVRDGGVEDRRSVRELLLTAAVTLGVSAPQLRTLFIAQIQRSGSQRSSLAGSFAHLAHGTLGSEAYLPWHPLALVCGAVMVLMLAAGFVAKARHQVDDAAARAVTVFALCFFLLLGLSGLGGRPRNALLLVPVFAVVFARAAAKLPVRMQQAAVIAIAVWSAVGISHILGRTGLAKASMNDRPEQVVRFIQATQRGCAVLVTYDPLLAFSASHPQMPGLLLVSQYTEPIASSALTVSGCSNPTLYVVRSFMGGVNHQWAERIDSELESAARLVSGPVETASFSLDAGAARKRALARSGLFADLDSGTRLPDYRYTVTAGTITASQISELRKRLPDFCTPEQCTGSMSLKAPEVH